MNLPSQDNDDKSWLRVPLTDPGEVAQRYDEWAASYDDELNAWGYDAPVQAARLMVGRLRSQSATPSEVTQLADGDAIEGPQSGLPVGKGPADGTRSEAEMGPVGAVRGAILDIGCGTGLTGLALHSLGLTILDGVDLSEVSLAAAGSRNIYRNLQRHNFNDSRLPFADNSYRGAECIGVLSYAHDPRALLVDACRVVQPGGTVVFSQRSDLWAEHRLPEVLEGMRAEGTIVEATWSQPQPYMPGNADFADQILVIYATLTVG